MKQFLLQYSVLQKKEGFMLQQDCLLHDVIATCCKRPVDYVMIAAATCCFKASEHDHCPAILSGLLFCYCSPRCKHFHRHFRGQIKGLYIWHSFIALKICFRDEPQAEKNDACVMRICRPWHSLIRFKTSFGMNHAESIDAFITIISTSWH